MIVMKFSLVSNVDKPIVDLKVIERCGNDGGKVICVCGNEIEGKNWTWKCSKCSREFMGPIMER